MGNRAHVDGGSAVKSRPERKATGPQHRPLGGVTSPPRAMSPGGVMSLQRLAGNRAVSQMLGGSGSEGGGPLSVQRLGETVPPLGVSRDDFMEQFGKASFASHTYKALLKGLARYEEMVGSANRTAALGVIAQIRTAGIEWLRHHPRKVTEDSGRWGVVGLNTKPDKNEKRRAGVEHLVYRDLIVAETVLSGGAPPGLTEVGTAEGGSVSDVKEMQDESGQNYFFKGYSDENDHAEADHAEKAGIGVKNTETGQMTQSFMANRAVAMSALDELFETGMVPKTDFAVVGGQFGTIQKGAQGFSPQHKEDFGEDDEQTFGVESPKDKAMTTSSRTFRRELNTLQLLDSITGQVDRHPGNYFVKRDSQGDVHIEAIDNDMAFGIRHTDPNEKLGQAKGVPTYLDDGVVETAIKVEPEAVALTLRRLLPPPEVDATVERWTRIREQLQAMTADQRIKRLRDWKSVVDQTQPGDESYAGTLGIVQSGNMVTTDLLKDKPKRKKVMALVKSIRAVGALGAGDFAKPTSKERVEAAEAALDELRNLYPAALGWSLVQGGVSVMQRYRQQFPVGAPQGELVGA